eukprot:1142424-Pelagomonas_calceolata.AAC.3
MHFIFKGLLGGGLLSVWRWRAGEGESERPGATLHGGQPLRSPLDLPGAKLEASQQQHNELSKQFQGAETLSTHSFWVWVGLPVLPIPWIN